MVLVDNLDLETHKTRDSISFLQQFEAEKNCLLVVNELRENLKRGTRNIPGVKVLHVDGLNVFDIMKHRKLFMEKAVLETLERRFAKP